jgi:iron-sulfur cluster assembly protein
MLQITDVAAQEIKSVMKQNNVPDNTYLKPFIQSQSCSGTSFGLGFVDTVDADDITLEVQGIKVLINEAEEPLLKSTTIDYNIEKKGFVFKNPLQTINNSSAGGCGSCSTGGCGSH